MQQFFLFLQNLRISIKNHYKANRILEEASSIELNNQLAWACASAGVGYGSGYAGFELVKQFMSSSYDDYNSNICSGLGT